MTRLAAQAYTVAWLCALPLSELPAAWAMLDEEHEPLSLPIHDENTYTYGSINGHNVVIACLPPGLPGKVSASKLVQPLSQSFPKLKIHLFVGIGGGVPREPPPDNPENDIHLGDVVIGWAERTGVPGVVQWDLLRYLEDGNTEPLSMLDKPDRRLVTALGVVLFNRVLGRTRFPEHLARLQSLPGFSHPGVEHDNLFKSTYPHPAKEEQCSFCDRAQLAERPPRVNQNLIFHQGTILSGDSVIKNAQRRNEISKIFHDALCFEMEAAGVMDDKRCLVIRGISDYADSHKNGSWQNYAAGTAAAFAREFLFTIQPQVVDKMDSAASVNHGAQTTALSPRETSSLQLPPITDSRKPQRVHLDLFLRQSSTSTSAVLLPKLFPPGLLTLGQLLPNPLAPNVNPLVVASACPGPHDYFETEPSFFEAAVPLNKKGLLPFGSLNLKGLRIRRGNLEFLHVRSDENTYRTLKDSDRMFREVCRDANARTFMEQMALYKKTFYFVVGLQELKEATITRALLSEEGDEQHSNCMPLDANSTLPMYARFREVPRNGVAVSESTKIGGVFGIEVRRVKCRLRKMAEPLLEEEVSWKYTYQKVKGSRSAEEAEVCVGLDTFVSADQLGDSLEEDEDEDQGDDENEDQDEGEDEDEEGDPRQTNRWYMI